MSLTTLSPDALRLVFIHLEPSDICALRLTCKVFCKFANDEVIWKRKFHRTFGGESVKKTLDEESSCELSYKDAFVKLHSMERNIRMGHAHCHVICGNFPQKQEDPSKTMCLDTVTAGNSILVFWKEVEIRRPYLTTSPLGMDEFDFNSEEKVNTTTIGIYSSGREMFLCNKILFVAGDYSLEFYKRNSAGDYDIQPFFQMPNTSFTKWIISQKAKKEDEGFDMVKCGKETKYNIELWSVTTAGANQIGVIYENKHGDRDMEDIMFQAFQSPYVVFSERIKGKELTSFLLNVETKQMMKLGFPEKLYSHERRCAFYKPWVFNLQAIVTMQVVLSWHDQNENQIVVMDIESGTTVTRIVEKSRFSTMAVLNSGILVTASRWANVIHIYSVYTGKLLRKISISTPADVFLQNGKLIATGFGSQLLLSWDFNLPTDPIKIIAIHPGGELEERTINCWNLFPFTADYLKTTIERIQCRKVEDTPERRTYILFKWETEKSDGEVENQAATSIARKNSEMLNDLSNTLQCYISEIDLDLWKYKPEKLDLLNQGIVIVYREIKQNSKWIPSDISRDHFALEKIDLSIHCFHIDDVVKYFQLAADGICKGTKEIAGVRENFISGNSAGNTS